MPAYCRSCRAPIVWAKHYRTGKPMPLEPAPDDEERGLYVLNGAGHAVPVSDLEHVTDFLVRYISHFATCPDAKSWRREE